jgi:hypothetical protein
MRGHRWGWPLLVGGPAAGTLAPAHYFDRPTLHVPLDYAARNYYVATYVRVTLGYRTSDQELVCLRHEDFPTEDALGVVWGQLLNTDYRLYDLGYA